MTTLIKRLMAFGFIAASSLTIAQVPMSEAPETATAYFISPQNGDTVSSPVKIIFGLKNMGVAPAGTDVKHTGHHHLIIDAPTPKAGQTIPADDNHKHFGKGQTETELSLDKGEHSLQLVLGDYIHRPHSKPVVSEVITITVE